MFFNPTAPRREQCIISNNYFDALSKLDGDQTVRVKENNKGLATGCWHRLEAAFMDVFTRSKAAKAHEKAPSWQIFNQQLTERFITKSGIPLDQKEISNTVKLLTPSTGDWLNGGVANQIVSHLDALAQLKELEHARDEPQEPRNAPDQTPEVQNELARRLAFENASAQ